MRSDGSSQEGHIVAGNLYQCAGAIVANIYCEHCHPSIYDEVGMTLGLGEVKLESPHDPEQIARGLIRVGTILDVIGEGKPIEAHPALYPNKEWCPTATDWMVVAILIAARCEVDSMTLTAMAASVFKGEQDALFG